jgi:hypothetical protein
MQPLFLGDYFRDWPKASLRCRATIRSLLVRSRHEAVGKINKTPITAPDLRNHRVSPFFEEYDVELLSNADV